MAEHFLWVEKYRPHKISDCILPVGIKSIFSGIVEQGKLPNLLLAGGPGMGKTTVARAMCEELDLSHMVLNSSDERGIDVLRTKMKSYASAKSFDGGRKVIILDEADHLTADAQAAMRGFMEDFAVNCSFVLTCNYQNKIIDAIHSRCSAVEFLIPKEEKAKLITVFYKRIADILQKENVEFQQDVVGEIIVRYFPDFRKTLNELQKFANSRGKIDEFVLAQHKDANFSKLFSAMKDKRFDAVREWVVSHAEMDQNLLYRKLYDQLKDYVAPSSVPVAVIHIADYMSRSSSVDPEICFLAMLTELMVNMQWK